MPLLADVVIFVLLLLRNGLPPLELPTVQTHVAVPERVEQRPRADVLANGLVLLVSLKAERRPGGPTVTAALPGQRGGGRRVRRRPAHARAARRAVLVAVLLSRSTATCAPPATPVRSTDVGHIFNLGGLLLELRVERGGHRALGVGSRLGGTPVL